MSDELYLPILLKSCVPLMLILFNQMRAQNEGVVFPNELTQTLIQIIDRAPAYTQAVEVMRQRGPIPANFELYVKCMKSIVQSTLFPHEFVTELIRILDFEGVPVLVVPSGQFIIDVPVLPLLAQRKPPKTKIEVW